MHALSERPRLVRNLFQRAAVVKAFCGKIEEAGYEAGVYAGEFFYVFKPFMKKIVDLCEKLVMWKHDRKTKKLLKNRNKDMQ